MVAQIIDGKQIADEILKDIRQKVKNLKQKPGLALVMVGNNPASEVYVNFKEKDSKEVGFYCERYNLSEQTSETELITILNELNNKPAIHGILVQLPLPKQIDDKLITDCILPQKEV